MKKYLVLANGMIFEGEAFGADGDVTAEIVFSTAMIGYVETLTDKSCHGQAVCQTFPIIGNYGVNESDSESDGIAASAYIVRECCNNPSNFRSEETLDEFLKKNGVPGICGIDTRLLTKTLRENGTMNGMLTEDSDRADLEAIKAYRTIGAVAAVSAKTVRLECAGDSHHKVALLDLGVNKSVISTLTKLGCDVYVLPYNTPADEIAALAPSGLFLSGGPGNPNDDENSVIIETLRGLIPHKIPTMAVGLGHQLLALANGMQTVKLKYGHRGTNHPVRCVAGGHLYITAQNHGYAVLQESIDNTVAAESFVNVNDKSNEGLDYKNTPAFSTQFTPDSSEISANTEFLYKRFIKMMQK